MATAVADSRAAPHDLEAERALLGAILLDNDVLSNAVELVSAADFFRGEHSMIFSTMLGLAASGKPIDVVTIAAAVDDAESVGGLDYLSTLIDGLPRAANVSAYGTIVAEAAHRRRLARDAGNLATAALDGEETGDLIERIAASGSFSDAGAFRVFDVAEYLSLKLPPRGLLLDPWLGEKDLAMVFGRRGEGKTWTVISIALAVATGAPLWAWQGRQSAPVLLVDGEMPVGVLQQRIASLLAGMNPDLDIVDVPLRILAADAQERALPALDTIDGQRILNAHIGDAKLVILDNISTLMGSGPENDAEAWGVSQRYLLDLRRRGVAVLLVHHAGKSGQQRGTSRREDVLDVVIKLSRPDDYQAEEGARFLVRFDKNRGLQGKDVAPIEVRLDVDEGPGGLDDERRRGRPEDARHGDAAGGRSTERRCAGAGRA